MEGGARCSSTGNARIEGLATLLRHAVGLAIRSGWPLCLLLRYPGSISKPFGLGLATVVRLGSAPSSEIGLRVWMHWPSYYGRDDGGSYRGQFFVEVAGIASMLRLYLRSKQRSIMNNLQRKARGRVNLRPVSGAARKSKTKAS